MLSVSILLLSLSISSLNIKLFIIIEIFWFGHNQSVFRRSPEVCLTFRLSDQVHGSSKNWLLRRSTPTPFLLFPHPLECMEYCDIWYLCMKELIIFARKLFSFLNLCLKIVHCLSQERRGIHVSGHSCANSPLDRVNTIMIVTIIILVINTIVNVAILIKTYLLKLCFHKTSQIHSSKILSWRDVWIVTIKLIFHVLCKNALFLFHETNFTMFSFNCLLKLFCELKLHYLFLVVLAEFLVIFLTFYWKNNAHCPLGNAQVWGKLSLSFSRILC